MSLRQLSLLLSLLFAWLTAWANFSDANPQGFHWYTHAPVTQPVALPKPQPAITRVVSTLTPTQTLHFLTGKTRDTLSQALLNPTVANTTRYMRAQRFWARQDQRFVRSWQQALLQHPELNYALEFPSDNNAIAIRDDEQKALIERTLAEMSQHFGLLLFYQGGSATSTRFVNQVLVPLVQQYHLAMISVTTDGQSIIGLPNPKAIPLAQVQHLFDLKARYLPAVFLVNLKTHQLKALSYGFMATDSFKTRVLDVLTDFQRLSYHGLGETRL